MISNSSTQFELSFERLKLNKGASAPLTSIALFLCPQYHSMVGVFWGALRSPFLFVYGLSIQLTSATHCLKALAGGLLFKQRSHIMCNATQPHSISEIEYSLAKQLPDMMRGFSIDTNYGALQVSPESNLEKEFQDILDSVERYQNKLLELELEGGSK